MNLDSLLYWLLVSCGFVLILAVPVGVWLGARALRNIQATMHQQQKSLTSFFCVCKEQFEKSSRNLSRATNWELKHHKSSLAELTAINGKLANYGKLAVDIRDFYAALNHFNEAMDKSRLFRRDMASSFHGFQTTVDQAKGAVKDFIDLVGFVKERQDKMLDVIQHVQATIVDQNENLRRITGQLRLEVSMAEAAGLSDSMKRLSDALDEQSEMLRQLTATSDDREKSWFGKISRTVLGK